jgi:hypothetical protein
LLPRKNSFRLINLSLAILLTVFTTASSFAQDTSLEFWPETDIWYKLSPSWRLTAFIPITKYNESKYRDLNIYLQADYSWGKTKHLLLMRLVDDIRAQQIRGWMVRGGYMKGWSLGENAGTYMEDMLFTELHRRTPLKNGLLLSGRFRTDFRWVGQDPLFSYRLRARVMLEKEFKAGHGTIVPYINAEPFWDSRYSAINRVRLIGGTTMAWGSRFAYEGNLTYQYDDQYSSPNMFALNIILHVYFQNRNAN